MNKQEFYLSSFQSCLPRYQESQSVTLNFLAQAHQNSLKLTGEFLPIEKLFARYGVKESQIHSRRFECPDLYQSEKIGDSDIQRRTEFFAERAEQVFTELYPQGKVAPEHLIHVTCTGYISPSAAQRLVADRSWSTEVTHAYHMGCYAALPAIRLAWGLGHQNKKVDIVHTEMCTLHFNPSLHSPEQLIVQTLFADGHIRYQVSAEKNGPSLLIRKIKEKILPDSAMDMTWMPGPSHMMMSLSREIPKKIESNIREFVQSLIEEVGLSLSEVLKKAIFAIHPGGPKIIEVVAQALELKTEQIKDSQQILFERGNMSSATLPHVWQSILLREPPVGTVVVSLAFGPGLTIFGAVFEVQ